MCTMHKLGLQIWPSPDVMVLMSTKGTLYKVAMLSTALEDALAYCTVEEFAAGFKKRLALQLRGIKQTRGSSGEGDWNIKRKPGNHCKSYREG
ncbi:unnamed protein product [Symbiodinium sp. CCMP2592]|nr:unnamed protein product [Symbiodinium sp. CCMP2592]